MTPSTSPTGIVLSYQSNFYSVEIDGVVYQCFLKGILKKEGTDVLVGDRVTVDNLDEGNRAGRIVQVLDRSSQLSRPKIANVTRAMVVVAIASPSLDLEQLDRYVTHVQLAGIDPMICISKTDLPHDPAFLQEVLTIYSGLGIPIYATSVEQPGTVQTLYQALKGETVVLAGPSGAGKSSLLNAIHPGLQLTVGEVSEKTQRGQHTTRHVALITLDSDTYVADTPGFSYLKFDTDHPQAIEAVFPDFAPYRDQCRFDNCLHLDEAGCAIRDHLDQISNSRYASYVTFQEEAKAYVETLQVTSQKQEYGYKTVKKGKARDVQILKLPEKQRQASRRTQRQQLTSWIDTEDDTLEEE